MRLDTSQGRSNNRSLRANNRPVADPSQNTIHAPSSARNRATGACRTAHVPRLRPWGPKAPPLLRSASRPSHPIRQQRMCPTCREPERRWAVGVGWPLERSKGGARGPQGRGRGHERKGPPNSRSYAMTLVRQIFRFQANNRTGPRRDLRAATRKQSPASEHTGDTPRVCC